MRDPAAGEPLPMAGWCEYDCYCFSECSGVKTAYYSHAVWNGCL